MKATDSFVLRPDVELRPVSALPDDVRAGLQDDEGFAVTRHHSRTPSSIIDSAAAALLEEFREPSSIIKAILRYSLLQKADPQVVLKEAFPLLGRLIAAKDLVSSESELAAPVSTLLTAGDVVAGFSVVRCIRLLDDIDIYEVKHDAQSAVLKIVRSKASTRAAAELENEARVLRHLEGKAGPALVAKGEHKSRPFLAIEWCSGTDAEQVAHALRHRVQGEDRIGLLALCCRIARAYAQLQHCGVVHGDVHPNNLLIDGVFVKIIDFGLATLANSTEGNNIHRAGVGPFFEPEYARCFLSGGSLPEASATGEQYSIAALLYFLITGSHYCDFSMDRKSMFEEIANTTPLTFSERGVAPWESVEQVLGRALSKDPELRFSSIDDFASALEKASVSRKSTQAHLKHLAASDRETLITGLIADVDFDSSPFVDGLPQGPTASLNYGSAGIAYAIYRIATVQESPELLALADAWSLKAVADIYQHNAFQNVELEITPETVGTISPFHTASGVFAVRALIDHARCDASSRHQAIECFVKEADQECGNMDLTLGRSGILIASALLLENTGEIAIRELGLRVSAKLLDEIRNLPPIGAPSPIFPYFGIAHGWAGLLYAQMRWCQATRTSPPIELTDRLGELASLSEHDGECLHWPVMEPNPDDNTAMYKMSGWCHGSAGYVFLWILAHQLMQRPEYMDLACGAARSTLTASNNIDFLCCGLAGRAYSLLALHRETDDSLWLDGAWALAGRAVRSSAAEDERRLSLYKGKLGVGVLLADLSAPERAAMPFFVSEGWPQG